MKVLTVCLGNICRSPLAEGILRDKAHNMGLDWEVDSAGTSSWHIDEAPDPRSRQVANKYQIDISRQKARQFKPSDFDLFDKILVMDQSNYRDVVSQASSQDDKDKVELILNYLEPGKNKEVPDPYWDDNGFEHVFQLLDKASDAFIKRHQQ